MDAELPNLRVNESCQFDEDAIGKCWGDPALSPYNTIAYYESVVKFLINFPDPRTDTSKPVIDS